MRRTSSILGAGLRAGSAQGFISPDLGDPALPTPVVKSGYNVLVDQSATGVALAAADCNGADSRRPTTTRRRSR